MGWRYRCIDECGALHTRDIGNRARSVGIRVGQQAAQPGTFERPIPDALVVIPQRATHLPQVHQISLGSSSAR